MKYVIDSSLAFMWVVSEPDSPKAILLRDDFRNGLHELYAPDLFVPEIGNALLVAERRGTIPKGQYPHLLFDVLSTPPALHSATPLMPRVAAITSATPVSAYDCLYVALAERENCQFVTGDQKLVRNLQKQFPFIIPISALP